MQGKFPALLVSLALSASSGVQAISGNTSGDLPPRVQSALELGQAAEQGVGGRKNYPLAVTLYCDAAQMGAPEGFFRVGRILARGPDALRNPRLANAYLALAVSLGHREADNYYNPAFDNAPLGDDCAAVVSQMTLPTFDLDAYLAAQTPAKRKIAAFIRRQAPRYNIDVRVALGVALAESNFEPSAVSSANAQGVMQLIPITQARFGVSKPFDPESNVRGGLAYLKFLKGLYGNDWGLVAAAYNAGENAVARHKGIPPYAETQNYVRRVLYFAGLSQGLSPCSGKSAGKAQSSKKTGKIQEWCPHSTKF